MRIRFWGTRGSIPTPGQRTVRYGGNTACVEVRDSGGALLVHFLEDPRLRLGRHLLERVGRRLVVEALDNFRSMNGRQRLRELSDLDRMQPRELILRRLELHGDGRGVGREISDVGPIEDLDRTSPS